MNVQKQAQGLAYSRAGLLGNPSDGFQGKTISLIVRNFSAQVTIQPDTQVNIVQAPADLPRFNSVFDLVNQIEERGYYGGVRLIKAAIKRFAEFTSRYMDVDLSPGFSIQYQTNIPRNVGLAGSSAIVVATLNGLCEFYQVKIPAEVFASLALSVENAELGIPAGLQDRVIQSMNGIVFMDFSQLKTLQGLDVGRYERLHKLQIDNLYIAYGDRAGEPTEVTHGDLRSRFQAGEAKICLLYTSPSPRDRTRSRMPSSA